MDEIKAQLAQELENAPHDFYYQEVLDFVQFLKQRYERELAQDQEDEADLAAALESLEDAREHGTIPWETIKAEIGL